MDDIDFLKANCERKSLMFFVDSEKRDRNLYPNPNEYAVKFSTPFKNVCKLQVIDASIPRTHYNIDMSNNKFVYAIKYDEFNEQEYTLYVDIGDYNDLQLIEEMNQHLNHITIDNLSNPGEKRKQFIFRSTFTFVILMNKSTMKSILGFDFKADTIFHSVDNPSKYLKSEIINLLNDETNSVDIMSSEYVLYQQFYCNSSGFVDEITFNVSNITEHFVMKVSILLWENNAWTVIGTSNVPLQSGMIFINAKFTNVYATHGKEYFIKLNVTNQQYADSLISYSLHFHLTNVEENTLYIKPNDGVTFTPDVCNDYIASKYKPNNIDTIAKLLYGHNDPYAITIRLNFKIQMLTPTFSLIAPCIYNLIGERYILLKCKEIENVSSTQRTFETRDENNQVTESQLVMGLAKFKLGVTGYQEERFDYNMIPTPDFHPIGKLQSLTLRFENNQNQLYDFKGINHTLTLLIEYYEPKVDNDKRLCMYHLNPNYQEYLSDMTNPDLHTF